MQRFIHIQAADFSNSNVKVTLTNNFFGATENLKNSMIDLDYINIDGIDFGGNNVYTDIADIYVCGPSVNRTIESADAYKKLGSMLVPDGETVNEIIGNVSVAAGSSVSVDSNTTISAGATIAGAGKDKSTINADKVSVKEDDVTIKDVTIKGSTPAGIDGSVKIGGANTTVDSVKLVGSGFNGDTKGISVTGSDLVIRNSEISNAFRGIIFWDNIGGNNLIENCTIDNVIYTFNINASTVKPGTTLTVKNSTLNGWTSYSGCMSLVSFEKCNLGKSNGYAYLVAYADTTFTDCTFNDGYKVAAGDVSGKTITITNCKLADGTVITAENFAEKLGDVDNHMKNNTVIVNGVTVSWN